MELAGLLGGDCADEGLIVVRRTLPLEYRHGLTTIGSGIGAALSYLCGGHGVADDAILLMDTETTGLCGGSGTVVFLLGLARFAPRGLELRQFLLTGFAGERALLQAAREMVCDAGVLVTYNGKSFDYPLLQTRYRLAGMEHAFAPLRHLDLLHPTRRAFGKCWSDCRLQTAEQRLLGFHRAGDLSGAEAPAAWLRWLRRGMVRDLPRVLRHNYWDLLALGALPGALKASCEQPAASGANPLAIARYWKRQGDERRACDYLCAHRARLGDAALLELAGLVKRRGNWSVATEIWNELAERGNLEALERLATYHERVSKQLDDALRYTHQLIRREHRIERQQAREKRILRRRQ
jgi:uncharacterized protein YprB with RNaseH-like and TPR domain